MIKYWSKLPTWGQWIAGTVAGVAAIYSVYVWSADTIDKAITSDAELHELEQHHDGDVAKILKFIADEKKNDRIQRNHRELSRLQRDLVGEKYSTEGERIFMVEEIKRIEKQLMCDQQNICDTP